MKKQGLDFAPPADRTTLLRRASFDLLGLPPTGDDVAALAGDSSPQAWERAIDRLLSSPHYGERWGRHWLDVAGYADSNGAVEADSVRPHAWRYRDYVVASHNADKPWDQFIQEQLAGDELAGVVHGGASAIVEDAAARERLVATGFLRMAPDGTADGPPDANLARNQVMADTLQIVGTSLLGLTVHCAQCHDHRYDPVAQEDYFRMRAVFEPVFDWKAWRSPQERLYSLYTEADRARAAEIEAQAVVKEGENSAWARTVLDGIFEKRVMAAPVALQETARVIRGTPENERTDEQRQFLKDHPDLNVGTHEGLLNVFDPPAEQQLFKKRDEVKALRATKPPEGFVMAATEVTGQVPVTVLFHRGDHDQPRQPVAPGEVTVLSAEGQVDVESRPSGLQSSGRRLAYARWLTSGRHPLVARVLVNRFARLAGPRFHGPRLEAQTPAQTDPHVPDVAAVRPPSGFGRNRSREPMAGPLGTAAHGCGNIAGFPPQRERVTRDRCWRATGASRASRFRTHRHRRRNAQCQWRAGRSQFFRPRGISAQPLRHAATQSPVDRSRDV
jgi:hypothetical protein